MASPLDMHAQSVGWHLTDHVKLRARRRGVRIEQILAAVTAPEMTYPNRTEVIMTCGRLAVVTNPRTRTILTVLLTGISPWEDKDAREVFAPA